VASIELVSITGVHDHEPVVIPPEERSVEQFNQLSGQSKRRSQYLGSLEARRERRKGAKCAPKRSSLSCVLFFFLERALDFGFDSNLPRENRACSRA
jgi:hypothetical protein